MKGFFRSLVVVGAFMISMVASSALAVNSATPSIYTVQNGVFKLESHTHTFALLVRALELEDEFDELIVETNMRLLVGPGHAGEDWSPGIYLYWDANKWVGIRNRSNEYLFGGFDGNKYTKDRGDWEIAPVQDVWTGLRLVMNHDTVEVYVTDSEGEWQYLRNYPRPSQNVPLLMIGKGMGGTQTNPDPYLANANRGSVGIGNWGSKAEYRSVLVKADGVVIFSEDFSDHNVEANGWLPLFYLDPELSNRLAKFKNE